MQHRKFRSEFKLQCGLDILSGRKGPTQICRENNISESVLNKWRQQFMERAPVIFENGSSKVSAESQRISELERLVGNDPPTRLGRLLPVENEIDKIKA